MGACRERSRVSRFDLKRQLHQEEGKGRGSCIMCSASERRASVQPFSSVGRGRIETAEIGGTEGSGQAGRAG